MGSEINFGEFCKKFQNYAKHEQNVKELCIKQSLIPLTDFYERLNDEMKIISSETTSEQCGSVSDYQELYKQFEDYPANLYRPKKRELQRTNSILLKSSTINVPEGGGGGSCNAAVNAGGQANSSITNLNLLKLNEQQQHQVSASEIYADFRKFHQKLKRLQATVTQNEQEQNECLFKLQQLEQFAQQLEKLMPAAKEHIKEAFDPDEKQKLMQIVKNMEELNFIRANSSIYQESIEGVNAGRLQTLGEIVRYALIQISYYNGSI